MGKISNYLVLKIFLFHLLYPQEIILQVEMISERIQVSLSRVALLAIVNLLTLIIKNLFVMILNKVIWKLYKNNKIILMKTKSPTSIL